MVSGRRGFQGDSAAETMHAILKEEPPDLLETTKSRPPRSSASSATASRKRPEQRFQSAHDLAFDLKAMATATGSSTAVRPSLLRRSEAGVPPSSAGSAAGITLGVLADRTLGAKAPAEPPTYRRLTFDRGTLGHARFAPDERRDRLRRGLEGRALRVFSAPLASTAASHVPSGCAPRWCYGVSSSSEVAVGLDAGPFGATLDACRSPGVRLARFLRTSPGRTGLPTARISPWSDSSTASITWSSRSGKYCYGARAVSLTSGCHPGRWVASSTTRIEC